MNLKHPLWLMSSCNSKNDADRVVGTFKSETELKAELQKICVKCYDKPSEMTRDYFVVRVETVFRPTVEVSPTVCFKEVK